MAIDTRETLFNDSTLVLEELHRAHLDSENFPRVVSEHFADIFKERDAFLQIPTLDARHPPESFPDRSLVRFRAMVQDTSLSTEIYLPKSREGRLGGWGITHAEVDDSDNSETVDYSALRENSVLWAVSIPAETAWCSDELSGPDTRQRRPPQPFPVVVRAPLHPHKHPHSDLRHVGVQVKIYDTEGLESLKSTEIATFVGILSSEPCDFSTTSSQLIETPTLHVLFVRLHAHPLVSRPFPRVLDSGPSAQSVALDSPSAKLREELITFIANEALGGDKEAGEWVLLTLLARVQSRHPPLLPPTLALTHFPSPPPVPSTTNPVDAEQPQPTLSALLSHLLPLTHTLPLTLERLNTLQFAPESKNEDLHAGALQLPQGTVLLVTEGGITEGKLLERGLLNVRVLQDIMSGQTLSYVFPYSQFSFQTDITCIVLSEGKKSTFFKTDIDVPLRIMSTPSSISALYKPADSVVLPTPEKLAAFRDLIVGARAGKVQVAEATSERIQSDFVAERQNDPSVTADDLIRRITIAKLYALSLHEPILTVETWERAKALDDRRRAALLEDRRNGA